MDIELLSSFIPEFRKIFMQRYEILWLLSREGILGRRVISSMLNFSERVVRDEINKLKQANLVLVTSAGVTITEAGENIIDNFLELYRDLNSLTELAEVIEETLGLKKVVVVNGDVSRDENVFKSLGIAASKIINEVLKDGDNIGITGGKTLSAIADELSVKQSKKDLTVIPARGSIGRSAEYQSNVIATKVADRLNADYKILSVPDAVSEETMKMLMDNQDVKEAYEKLQNLDILIFGLGRADVMTRRRGINEELKSKILKAGAVSEAFGHYFDIDGNEVYHSQSIGIAISEFLKIPSVIGVAGGEEKAEAIISISSLRPDMVLVIDESVANRIINIRR